MMPLSSSLEANLVATLACKADNARDDTFMRHSRQPALQQQHPFDSIDLNHLENLLGVFMVTIKHRAFHSIVINTSIMSGILYFRRTWVKDDTSTRK